MLDLDLQVIGRRVETQPGDHIDLLCLDRAGDVVIADFAFGRRLAKVLDHDTWAGSLSSRTVQAIGAAFLGSGGLGPVFRSHFGAELPVVLNRKRRTIVIGEDGVRLRKALSSVRGAGARISAVALRVLTEPRGTHVIVPSHLSYEITPLRPRLAHKDAPRRVGHIGR